ncbi:SNF2 family N-terminal domain-containing protein [Gaertneriomyces semiglobifer]|nr:SNF2 family N-terminal domain-containing protein [Gaertneriomyces semiglobifer]
MVTDPAADFCMVDGTSKRKRPVEADPLTEDDGNYLSAVSKKPRQGVKTKSRAVQRLQWLTSHRDLFIPVLPEQNFFTRIAEGKRPTGTPVPYRLLPTPAGVTATLKPYQQHGISFLVNMYENGVNAILGDEMGLGKTLQTLTLFMHVKEQGEDGPFLVVCPLSVLSSWMNEMARWVPSFSALCFHGALAERKRLKHTSLSKKYDVYLTTYEQYVAEESWFKSKKWRIAVLDEGHKVKNYNTHITKSVQGLNAQMRLILTGTPLQNNLVELWTLFHWLFPEVFTETTVKKFHDSFDLTRGMYDLEMIDNCRKLLERVMLRRMKSDVELSIPPKEEMTIYVPLSPMQKFWYKRLLTRLDRVTLEEVFGGQPVSNKTEDGTGSGKEGTNTPTSDVDLGAFNETKDVMERSLNSSSNEWKKLMNILMQLRKVCNHPYMLPNAEPDPFIPGEHLILASSKLICLDKLLKHRKGHKTLIFSGFTRALDIIEDFLAYRGIRYGRLDGGTSRVRRNLDIRLFNHPDSPYEVFLISTRAGGLGINLATADTVIFFDNDWNPQQDLQALARAHRIGQQNTVKVFRIVCQDTVEEQMQGRLQKKLYLSAKVTEDMRDVHGSGEGHNEEAPKMTKGELMSMLRRGARAVTRIFESAEEFLKEDMESIIKRSIEYQKRVDDELDVDIDDDFQLEGMEMIRSRLFEGKTIKRSGTALGEITREWQELTKRTRTERVVMIDGHSVLAETVGCDMWEARKTISGSGGNADRLKDQKRARKKFGRETGCFRCHDDTKRSAIVPCSRCPRAYHKACMRGGTRALSGYICCQHECTQCKRSTVDAGGMLFRCQTCPRSYCEDHLVWDDITPVGDVLPELYKLGYGQVNQAYWIRCQECTTFFKENPEEAKNFQTSQDKLWKLIEEEETNVERMKKEAEIKKSEVVMVDDAPKAKDPPPRNGTTTTTRLSTSGQNGTSNEWSEKLRKSVIRVKEERDIPWATVAAEIQQLSSQPSQKYNGVGVEKAALGISTALYLTRKAAIQAVETWVVKHDVENGNGISHGDDDSVVVVDENESHDRPAGFTGSLMDALVIVQSSEE